jgi:hypothetical protein
MHLSIYADAPQLETHLFKDVMTSTGGRCTKCCKCEATCGCDCHESARQKLVDAFAACGVKLVFFEKKDSTPTVKV